MAEQSGKRETLRARATAQAAQTATDAPDDLSDVRSGQYGMLARQAANLISGKPATVKGEAKPVEPEGDEDHEEDGGEHEGPGAAPGEGEEGEQDEGEGRGTPGELATADDAAKALGLSRKEFNALTVQVGADSMTIGELKDKLPELAKLDRSRAELDDERGTWELERIASYRNLSAIIDALPKNAYTAGLLRQLEAQHENTRTRELEALHFARPRWADPNYSTEARAKIHAIAKEYGFTRAEVDGLMDHRQVLLAQDFAELRERVRASRESARKLAEGGVDRPSGQKGAARADGLAGNGAQRRTHKPTQESIAQRAGAIMRRR